MSRTSTRLGILGLSATILSLGLLSACADAQVIPPAQASRPPVGPMLTDQQVDSKLRPTGFDLPTSSQVSLILNGFRRSQLDPCGCPSKPLGGFDREAKVIERIKATGGTTLMADAGGTLKEFTSLPDLSRAAYLFKAMRQTGYTVGNVGFTDVLPGVDKIKAMAKDADFRLVSSNITDASGQLLFDPYFVETVNMGGKPLRVAFVGSTRQRVPGSGALEGTYLPTTGADLSGIKIADPVEKLRAVLPEARSKSDVVVLLHFGRRDQVPEMLRALDTTSSVDLIVAGEWGGSLPISTTSSLPLLVTTGFEGRQVTHAMVELGDQRRPAIAGARTVEITQDLPQVPALTSLITESKQAASKVMPTPHPGVPAVPAPRAQTLPVTVDPTLTNNP